MARIAAGIAIAWLPLLVFAAITPAASGGGVGRLLADGRLQAISLFAIPTMLAAEDYVDGRIAAAVRCFFALRLLDPADEPRLTTTLRRAERLRGAGLAEVVLLVIAWMLSLAQIQLHLGSPLLFVGGGRALTPTGAWFFAVVLPLAWFLIGRWAWRYAIWVGVLFRISRLRLRLIPTHADKLGSLGFLPRTQASFAVAVFALGVVISAVGRPDFSGLSSDLSLVQLARGQAIFTAAALIVLFAPLAFFSPQLLEAKRRADLAFSRLMAEHGRDFQARWFRDPPEQSPLGSPDMSTQTDLSSGWETASKMRWFPWNFRPYAAVLVAGFLLPVVPRLMVSRELLLVVARALGHGG